MLGAAVGLQKHVVERREIGVNCTRNLGICWMEKVTWSWVKKLLPKVSGSPLREQEESGHCVTAVAENGRKMEHAERWSIVGNPQAEGQNGSQSGFAWGSSLFERRLSREGILVRDLCMVAVLQLPSCADHP